MKHETACKRCLYENSRAAQLFERAAALVDASDNPGKVYRARVLRRAARAVVDEPTPPMSRARLDEARELMARARELLEMVPDTRQYSAAYEMGDWHDDMAWILYRVDEYREALEHCALASEGYMTTRDLSNAARPLALAVAIHMEEGEPLQARESIAAVRQLLSHRRWSNHPALARVAQLEEQLDLRQWTDQRGG